MLKRVSLIGGTLLLTLTLLSNSVLLANTDTEIKYQKVNPNDGIKYGMKRLEEKTKLFLFSPFPNAKADYFNGIINNRLAELKYVVDKKDSDNFENATKRYFSLSGEYAQYLKKKKLNDKMSLAIETFNSHLTILEKLRDTFDPQTAQWRFLQDDINYIGQYSALLVP